jgi:cytochrome c peroxidase
VAAVRRFLDSQRRCRSPRSLLDRKKLLVTARLRAADIAFKEKSPMKKVLYGLTALIVLAAVGAGGWFMRTPARSAASPISPSLAVQQEDGSIAEPIRPIPLSIKADSLKVALGRELFHDTRLSANNTVSCATCHDLKRGGADGLPLSRGINGQIGEMNAPTVYNSAFNFRQFWDGRADTLEQQVEGPIHNPKEMACEWAEIISRLSSVRTYVSAFAAIYPDGIKEANIRDAIATFERSLITPNSRLDQYLRGNTGALTQDERKGYQLFKDLGCIACHQGVNVGGNMFQKLGVMRDYFATRRPLSHADMGRFNVTGKESDRHFFKVPSLRNIELTGPYFHDGSAKTLDDAVRIMINFQLGQTVDDGDVKLVVAFLKTLTGQTEAEHQ